MPDPRLLSDWRVAKSAAGVLANACGGTLLQWQGHPRLIIGGMVKDTKTWLEMWSLLYRLRLDQISQKK